MCETNAMPNELPNGFDLCDVSCRRLTRRLQFISFNYHERPKKGSVTLAKKGVTLVLKPFATDDVLAETDAAMVRTTQASRATPPGHGKQITVKALG